MTHQPTLPTSHQRPSRQSLLHPRHRRPLTYLLVFLGSVAVVSHILSTFPSLSANLYNKLPFSSSSSTTTSPHSMATSSSCTKEIGTPHCCALFIRAEPCMEECRRQFVDRVTMELGLGWEECVEVCLAEYRGTCGVKGEGVEGVAVGGGE